MLSHLLITVRFTKMTPFPLLMTIPLTVTLACGRTNMLAKGKRTHAFATAPAVPPPPPFRSISSVAARHVKLDAFSLAYDVQKPINGCERDYPSLCLEGTSNKSDSKQSTSVFTRVIIPVFFFVQVFYLVLRTHLPRHEHR